MVQQFGLADFSRRWGLLLLLSGLATGLGAAFLAPNARAQVQDGRAITVLSDIQEANQVTGVVTARGNVQIFYPARDIKATSAQAQYFSQEGRIVLTGNVFVVQEGNTVRGETITYLIEEGRFIATPQANRQVESVYIISDPEAPRPTANAAPPTPFNPKPAFKEAHSDPVISNQ
ncbi:OstA family protein [Spirulina subsalsa FACHB-351]|uniref:OstA family protein n=1 Tax=Spirulina subsalsa FACHB-351 TaxID=234711 RepID=A0ABT3L159_9CYAN|nr:LptA/OstA family protein [Spirulina subsalsa]MCW6035227.1 OstA family protein [Spirulina subsalsa FACHB-351]